MIHPNTEVRFVNKTIGHGVFATARIPKGTITFVQDPLDIKITPAGFAALDKHSQEIVEKYSFIDPQGIRIVSWDNAKYVNHSCDCNTMSTGYGFEIAIRDIEKGEELTDEYGLFNIPVEIPISCGCKNCRRALKPTDIETYHPIWDGLVKDALARLKKVKHQPLWHILDLETRTSLINYLEGRAEYRSVLTLKHNLPTSTTKQTTARASKKSSERVALLDLPTPLVAAYR